MNFELFKPKRMRRGIRRSQPTC